MVLFLLYSVYGFANCIRVSVYRNEFLLQGLYCWLKVQMYNVLLFNNDTARAAPDLDR